MPSVIFEFDAKREYEYIKFFEENFGEVELPKQLRKIWSDKKKSISYIEKAYNLKKKGLFEKSWRKIEKDYFRLVEEITGHRWSHKTYRVILTKYMYGFCNPLDVDAKEVTCRQYMPAIERNYIVAHELLHSHYFGIVAKKKDVRLFSTELNENFNVLALCFSDIRGLLVKPKDEWIIRGWVNSNQKAAKYFDALLPLWEGRKSFEDYLKKSKTVLKERI